MVTRCHSLSLIVIRCHSLYHSLSLVVPLAVIRCHSLSFVVTRCTTRCHSLSLDVLLDCLFINDHLDLFKTILICLITCDLLFNHLDAFIFIKKFHCA